MPLQKIFRTSYAQQLEDEAKNGIGIERYTKHEFEFDKNQVLMIPTIEQPLNLLDTMDSNNDLKSAIALFEAYKNLTPLQAQDFAFWTYLAHADLFPYVQQKNNAVLKPGFNDPTYITNHFFKGFGGLIYHPLAGLWWNVYCTYVPEEDDPYKYTRFIFKDYGLRVTYIGRYRIFRNKPELLGFLDFMINNPKLFSVHARQRYRWIAQYLNRVGGSINFSNMTKEQVYCLIDSISETVASIQTDDDVKSVY